MTRLELWKQQKIKEIEEMDINSVIKEIQWKPAAYEWSSKACDYCINKNNCNNKCDIGMKKYLQFCE